MTPVRRWVSAIGLFAATALGSVCWILSPPGRLWSIRRYTPERLHQLSVRSPHDWMVQLVLAEDLEHSGDFIHATDAYREALKIQPRSVEALVGLARVSLSLEDTTTALDAASRALEIDHHQPLALLCLGEAEAEEGEFRQASAALKQATRQDAQNGEAWSALARVDLQLRAWKDALKAAERAAAIEPHSAGMSLLLGTALTRTGSPERALGMLEVAASQSRTDGSIWLELGRAEMASGPSHFSDAESSLSRAASLLPRDPTPYLLLGRLYKSWGHPSRSITAYRTAVQRDPNNEEAFLSLAQLLKDSGDSTGSAYTLRLVAESRIKNDRERDYNSKKALRARLKELKAQRTRLDLQFLELKWSRMHREAQFIETQQARIRLVGTDAGVHHRRSLIPNGATGKNPIAMGPGSENRKR